MFLLVAGLLASFAVAGCSPVSTLGARQMPAEDGPQQHVLAGALHGRKGAFLIVRDAASRVEVRLADLPGLLYRISTPADSGLAPAVTGTPGRVRLGLRPTGADGPDTVEILLNRAVRWDIRLPAGAGEQHLDLASGRIRRVELGSGTGLVSMRLPPPRGTVPIKLTGGVGEIAVAIPAGTPLGFRLRGGAELVAVPWTRRARAEAGVLVAPAGWVTARNRYAVDVESEVGTVTVWG
ncbi:hypothetical protein [Actinoplanes sp. NPDC049118]|uniref:hypothetical protein n=1 Tax=Actinoplanes sp. NPDC049118 TaxID=3155769 RepID=UPI0033CC8029